MIDTLCGFCPECGQAALRARDERHCVWCSTPLGRLRRSADADRLPDWLAIQLHGQLVTDRTKPSELVVQLVPSLGIEAPLFEHLKFDSSAELLRVLRRRWTELNLPTDGSTQ